MAIYSGLYEAARAIDQAAALDMIRNAQTAEEERFWTYIADMNIQRAQREAIERNVF